MGNLGLAGANSLQALNQWISVIDTNLSNTKRIGYKETRLSLKTNEIETLGKSSHNTIQIPSSSLLLDKSLILDYVQGALTSTENVSDFAIEGKGYFVVQDNDGKNYATRDGQFHFSTDGFMVNAQGLKVLSYGQDFIRVPPSEQLTTDSYGTTVGKSLYGSRQLMMIELPNPSKLYYSKYGFTTFEIGDFLPINVDNSFDKTMDGLSPYLAAPSTTVAVAAVAGATSLSLDSVSGMSVGSTISVNGQVLTVSSVNTALSSINFAPPLAASAAVNSTVSTNYQTLYTHNKANFIALTAPAITTATSIQLANVTGISNGSVITLNGQDLLVSGIAGNIVSFATTPLTGPAVTGNVVSVSGNLNIDLSVASQAALTAHTFTDFNNSFRFSSSTAPGTLVSLGFNFGQKTHTDTISDSGYFAGLENNNLVLKDSLGNTLASTALPAGMAANTEYELSLLMDNGKATLLLNDVATGNSMASLVTSGVSGYEGSYQSIGTYNKNGNGASAAGTSVAITAIHVNERARDAYYSTRMIGGNATKIGSLVRQQFVEESTATIADTMPLLSNTQKIFSALSKVISVSNSITDDLNQLIR